MPLKGRFRVLNAPWRGYDNSDGLQAFFSPAMPIRWQWRNRRSPKRRDTGQRFEELLKRSRIARPRITDQPQTQPALSCAFR